MLKRTTNLNATLLKELKSLTTWPPLFYTNTVSSDTTLEPQAPRDTDPPDLGYHYVPLDYLVSSLEVTNATLTLTNGVAVGVYGRYGLLLRNGAQLVSEGTPVNLNRLTRYQAVQEQPVDLQNADWNALIHCETACATPPQVRLRFAEVSVMADSATKVFLFKNPYPIQPIELTDCQLHSVRVYLYPNQYHALGESLAVTNCLWNRVSTDLAQGASVPITPFTVYFRNTTLREGYINASMVTNSPGAWSFVDNFFAQSANWFQNQGGTWTNNHNGYTTGIVELPNEQDAQRYVTTQFVAGALGGFYIPSTSSLTNHGSRTADAAGLYHYTTQTSNARETNSVVDIGFHYVAVDANGVPFDANGNGVADYAEDRDGDQMPDSWEIAHGLNPLGNDAEDDPDGDWITNYQEYLAGSNPTDTMVVAWGKNYSGQCQVPSDLRRAVAVAGGFYFSLALKEDGNVEAWGDNTYGQSNVPANATNVMQITANYYAAAALKNDGSVVVWGYFPYATPASATNLSAISMGWDHMIARRSDGTVLTWGNASNLANAVPMGLGSVSMVAAGWDHNVALHPDGRVSAWGDNGNNLDYHLLDYPTDLTNACFISALAQHSLALRSTGTVTAWGVNDDGQTNVLAGLSAVRSLAAGMDFSLALKNDGTVAAWGSDAFGQTTGAAGLNQVTAIAAGSSHGLAVRGGRLTPVFVEQPASQADLPGSAITFTAKGIGLAGVRYQWQHNGVNLGGATNDVLVISNIQTNNEGTYTVVISTGAGSVTSQPATLTLVRPPAVSLTSPALPFDSWATNATRFDILVNASALAEDRYPLSYQWKKDGVAIAGETRTGTSIMISGRSRAQIEGDYSLYVTNAAGSTTVGPWTLRAAPQGGVGACGANVDGQCDWPANLTNIIGLAAGHVHSLALKEDGRVISWGHNWASVPADLTNAVAVAAGYEHSLALRDNGTVTAWGTANFRPIQVPTNLSGVKAIGAGWYHSVAMGSNGVLTVWGTNALPGWDLLTVPATATNVIELAAGAAHTLALRGNGTIVAWGCNDSGQTNVLANLTNIVAVAAGGMHSLALGKDGFVRAWGDNSSGQCTVPAGLSNVMAIAAGFEHSVALKNDGTVVSWGNNSSGQRVTGTGLTEVKLIAAGGNHSLISTFSLPVSYSVEAANDLLVVYNTNSGDSFNVYAHYLMHRPMASNANVLPMACPVGEFTGTNDFENQIKSPLLSWQNANPTLHPNYIVLLLDVPSRITNAAGSPYDGSVSYVLRKSVQGIPPFITHINMNGTNDCKAYIDKLEYFGTNYCLGKLLLSPCQGGYNNTNYVLDGIRHGGTNIDDYSGSGFVVSSATNGLLAASVLSSAIHFYDGLEIVSNLVFYPLSHPTSYANLAGYMTWGVHSSLGPDYATNGAVSWGINSRWWIIATCESYNGQRIDPQQGTFIKWFSPTAFGGTAYAHTPVAAVSHVQEPFVVGINDAFLYFGLWAQGKNFAITSWKSAKTAYFQAVGDPFITK